MMVDAKTRDAPKVAVAATKSQQNKAAMFGVWVGVVLYILIGGHRPLRGGGKECKDKIRYEEYKFHQEHWSAASDEAKLLIPRILAVDPSRRIAAKEALNSTWITMAEESTPAQETGFQIRKRASEAYKIFFTS
jgi:serine/threonine protein kinase